MSVTLSEEDVYRIASHSALSALHDVKRYEALLGYTIEESMSKYGLCVEHDLVSALYKEFLENKDEICIALDQ